MPRPRVTSRFERTAAAAPNAASLRILAFIGTARKEYTVTEEVTKGASGGTDNLAQTATSILRVGNLASTTDYTTTVDYTLSAGDISWAPAGAEPTTGAKYFVTYTYAKVAADYAPKFWTSNFGDIVAEYGDIEITGTSLDTESYLTMAAQVARAAGADVFITVQVNNAAAVPTAAEFQTAIDALENTKSLGVAPYYIVPLIGELSDSDADAVNAAALTHCDQMADDQYRLERRAYIGPKANATSSTIIADATAFAATRATYSGNFDPFVTVSQPDGNVEVTLDGSFAALAVAALRSSQEVSEPAMNKVVSGLSGLGTHYDPPTVDLLVDSGVMLLEDDGGILKVVDDNTTNVSDEIESSIPTVEHRDVLISGARKRVKDRYQGRRGSTTIAGEMEETIDSYLNQEKAKGAIQKSNPAEASRVPATLNSYQIEFSYLPAGKVRDIVIKFGIDLSL